MHHRLYESCFYYKICLLAKYHCHEWVILFGLFITHFFTNSRLGTICTFGGLWRYLLTRSTYLQSKFLFLKKRIQETNLFYNEGMKYYANECTWIESSVVISKKVSSWSCKVIFSVFSNWKDLIMIAILK